MKLEPDYKLKRDEEYMELWKSFLEHMEKEGLHIQHDTKDDEMVWISTEQGADDTIAVYFLSSSGLIDAGNAVVSETHLIPKLAKHPAVAQAGAALHRSYYMPLTSKANLDDVIDWFLVYFNKK